MLTRACNAIRSKRGQEKRNWSVRDALHKWLPITEWLPKYSPKSDLPGDIAAGLTLGIVNVPQGLAFAMLASLPPITGLYVALVPVFAYVVLGTSKHLSVGSFAIVSIMVGDVIEKKMGDFGGGVSNSTTTSSGIAVNVSISSTGIWNDVDNEKITLSATLSLLVGFIQAVMGFARLGFVTIFLSDPLISGFTTGAACWIFISQIQHILAIYPPRYTGPFAFIKTCISTFQNIAETNLGSVVISVLCIALLIFFKHLNKKYKHKFKFPIPAELIVVVLTAGISYAGDLKGRFNVKIVESIPKGLPPISVPRNDFISELFVDALVIAVVAFAVNISLAKLFSQKHKYSMDANQELIAYGVQNIVGCFFSCFVSAASLGRSLIQESLGKSQITSVISCAIILIVLTALAPLFEPLPNAVLAAIIIVAIGPLFNDFLLVRRLCSVNKIDALTWVVTWSAVILFGIDFGLGIGVIFQLLSLTYRLSKTKLSIVGEVRSTVGVYEDVDRYEGTMEITGIVIVRFQSPLCFVNVERFKEKLRKSVLVESRKKKAKSKCTYPTRPCAENFLDNRSSKESGVSSTYENSFDDSQLDYIHSIIIDCSSFSFIDSVAVSTLSQIAADYEQQDVHIYLVNYSYNVLKVLKNGNFFNGDNRVSLLPSIPEALQHAHKRRHNQITSFLNEPDGTSEV